MTKAPVDIQDAFDGLTRSIYHLQEAFMGIAGLLLTKLDGLTGNDLDALADDLQGLAELAGRNETAITGKDAAPNRHLEGLSLAMRSLATGNTPRPFSVIDGGAQDED